jgi:putative hydrolase of the HAD superfamily
MTVKAIIFDYGNVISLPQDAALSSELYHVSGIGPLFEESYWRFRLAYDSDELGADKYWQTVAAYANVRLSKLQVDRLIQLDAQSWMKPRLEMLNWVERLRREGYKIALLSNMPRSIGEMLVKQPWFPRFDTLIFSCELGVTKPSPEIYSQCLKGLNLPGEQALFLDDREENIIGAEALNIQSVLFQSPELTQKALSIRFPELPKIQDGPLAFPPSIPSVVPF